MTFDVHLILPCDLDIERSSSASLHTAMPVQEAEEPPDEGAPLPTPEAFDFPYPKPYDIQLDLMKTVFRAIEDRKIAIVSFDQRSL